MFSYRPHTLPQQFFVIGGGGTGGRLVPLLAQFLRSITKDAGPRGWLVDPSIIIIDDDVVEEKNLIRQNFIQRDVGKFKAVVLAERYSKAFGVNIHPVVQRITNTTPLEKTLAEKVPNKDYIGSKDAVIFMCVDSVKARKDVLLAFTHMNINLGSKPYFVVDAGNEDTFGQVKFFHLQAMASGFSRATSKVNEVKAPVMAPEKVALPFIPLDLDYYDSIVDNQAASCADLDQTLAINAQMAVMMMGVVQNYLYFKPFTYSGRNFDLAGAGSTTWMTMEVLRRMTWFMKEEVAANSFRSQFPKTRSVAAKPIFLDYVSKNRDKLVSMGIDPDTGKKFEAFTAVSIIEDPKPVEEKRSEMVLEPVTVNTVPAMPLQVPGLATPVAVPTAAEAEDMRAELRTIEAELAPAAVEAPAQQATWTVRGQETDMLEWPFPVGDRPAQPAQAEAMAEAPATTAAAEPAALRWEDDVDVGVDSEMAEQGAFEADPVRPRVALP